MKKQTVAVVIPTIRNLDFLESWQDEFKDCLGVIVEDHQKKEVKTPNKFFKQVYHYSWQDINKELGKNSWIIPRKNAGIRSYGFLKAFQKGVDIIITLDDDCYPVKNQDFVNQHLENLSYWAPVDWFPTYPHRSYFYTRGVPYGIRNKKEVVISHGLWKGVVDFDAPTQLFNMDLNIPTSFPFVEHKKASNVFKNLEKEARGIHANEMIYNKVMKVRLNSKNLAKDYKDLAEQIEFPKE